jgi:autotransporter-associated beta strand protein
MPARPARSSLATGRPAAAPISAARVITGGSGTATLRFTQQFAAGSGSDPLYPFYTTLTGSLALVQEGIGTTSLQPLYGANTFAGAVTVNAGVLATTGSAAALAGVTEITVNSGGTLALGQSDGVNNLGRLHARRGRAADWHEPLRNIWRSGSDR